VSGKRIKNLRVARRSFRATGNYLPKYVTIVPPRPLCTNRAKASILDNL
jgi:hypothetical protein